MSDVAQRLSVVRYLVDAARHAPSADNSQPFDFAWDGNALSICFSKKRCGTGIFGEVAHATLLSLGAAVECIVQAAEEARVGLVWNWDEIGSGRYVTMSLDGFPKLEVIPSELPLYGRHTNRFPFSSQELPEDIIRFSEQQTEGKARVANIPKGKKFDELIRCVRISAASRFRNEELHCWLIDSLRFNIEAVNRGDGLDVATLNLPLGGRSFLRFISDWKRMKLLNQFGVYKLLAFAETQLLVNSSTILCVIGNDSLSDCIDTGRLLARLWIELNRRGIGVHPYYVVTDQLIRLENHRLPIGTIENMKGVRDRLPMIIGTKRDEKLHMLLRIGLPTIKAPRSKRLPLAAVLSEKL